MDSVTEQPDPATNRASAFENVLAGAAFGILLGLLIGLSASPVVSIVVAGFVGLLAGFLGLSDNGPLRLGRPSIQRLIGLAMAASLVLPGAVWIRTHNLLAPSIAEQIATARILGYRDGTPEERDFLTRMRFGFTVTGVSLPIDQSAGAPQQVSQRAEAGVLYAGVGHGFCDNLQKARTSNDVAQLLAADQSVGLQRMSKQIKELPAEQQKATLAYARIFLCQGR